MSHQTNRSLFRVEISFQDEQCRIKINNNPEQIFYEDSKGTIVQEWCEKSGLLQSSELVDNQSNYIMAARDYFYELLEKSFRKIETLVVTMPTSPMFFSKNYQFESDVIVNTLIVKECKNGESLGRLLENILWKIDTLKIGTNCECLHGIGDIYHVGRAKSLKVGTNDINDDQFASFSNDRANIRSICITERGIEKRIKNAFVDNYYFGFEICNPKIERFYPSFIKNKNNGFEIVEEYETNFPYFVQHFIVTVKSSTKDMEVKIWNDKISVETYPKIDFSQKERNWNYLPNEIKLIVVKYMNIATQNNFRLCSRRDNELVKTVPSKSLNWVSIEFDDDYCRIIIDVDIEHKFMKIGDGIVQYEKRVNEKLVKEEQIETENSANDVAKQFFKPFLERSGYRIGILFFDLNPQSDAEFFDYCNDFVKVRELSINECRGSVKLEDFLMKIYPSLEFLRIAYQRERSSKWSTHLPQATLADKLIMSVENVGSELLELRNKWFQIIGTSFSEPNFDSFLEKVLCGAYPRLEEFQFVFNSGHEEFTRHCEAKFKESLDGINSRPVPKPEEYRARRDYRSSYILTKATSDGEEVKESIELFVVLFNSHTTFQVKRIL